MTDKTTKIYLIITIDTEVPQGLGSDYDASCQGFRSFVYGKVDQTDYGFPKIMEICNKHNCKATFFVSVFDYGKYGESAIAEVCRKILQDHHDDQLHTHPNRVYDKKKPEMCLYPLNKQIQIVKDGKALLMKWTGENLIAHRAGAYGLNEDTLKALHANEIPIDSSMFYNHHNCKVTWTKNKVVERNGIIEIPVTGFYRTNHLKVGPVLIKGPQRFVKTDIDWATLDELIYFVKEAKKHDIRVINLFMHSYSLLKFDQNLSNIEPDRADINKLDDFLSFVSSDPLVKIITTQDFYKMYQQDPREFVGSDYVPTIENPIYFKNLLKSIYNKVLKN